MYATEGGRSIGKWAGSAGLAFLRVAFGMNDGVCAGGNEKLGLLPGMQKGATNGRLIVCCSEGLERWEKM